MKLLEQLSDWMFGKPKGIGVIEFGKDVLGQFPAQGHDIIVMTITGTDSYGKRMIELITKDDWESMIGAFEKRYGDN